MTMLNENTEPVMNNSSYEPSLQINKGKFFPPVVNPAHYLFREMLIKNILRQIKQKRLMLIEAQAGQGKSILAAQVISHLKVQSGWYQIGPEDIDPVSFLESLITGLRQSIPNFSPLLLEDMIRKGEINVPEYPSYIDILCKDLEHCLSKEYYLVFDDVHLLEESLPGQSMLLHLVNRVPKSVHFILISRRPIFSQKAREVLLDNALIIKNTDIKLTEEEIFNLCNDILHISISYMEARQLWKLTEGWIMGLILASRSMEKRGVNGVNTQSLELLNRANAENLADFFRKEIFSRIDKDTGKIFHQLSLLESIPLPLAMQITGNEKTDSILKEVTARNCFIRSVNREGTEYVFHHLFRESLFLIASEDLSPAEKKIIYKTAGDYYAQQKSIDEALSYYAHAEDYIALDKLLEREGMSLYALNRLAFLESVLNRIPGKIIHTYGWLSFFYGLIWMQKDPPQSLTHLKRAVDLFSRAKQEIGRLYALSKILYFHVNVDAKFNLGLPVLKELEVVFNKYRDKLDAYQVITIAHILSYAFTFIESNFRLSRKYCDIALSLAAELKLDNMLADVYPAKGWGCYPNWPLNNKVIEESHYLTECPSVNPFNKMMLRLCAINLLEMEGDFENYYHQEAQLTSVIENNVVAKTVVGNFLLVWQIDIAIAMGDYEKASSVARRGLDSYAHAHVYSQYLHYQAFLEAVFGNREAAIRAAEESLKMRREVGGRVFTLINLVNVGNAYAVLGLKDKAKPLLLKAIKISRDIGEEYLRTGAYAALAYLCIKHDEKKTVEYVTGCIQCLKKNNYRHYFGWSPTIIQPVLEYAVAHGIEENYARTLAADRFGIAILPDGTSIPLLKIRTLGNLNLSIRDNVVEAQDLTPAMRELLALLISSPDMKMYQEEILTIMWPDISPAKARSRFDTLLLELRKILKSKFDNTQIDYYLILKKGVFYLTNCRPDADIFIENVRKGFAHIQKKELWQAGNRFYSASLEWTGPYCSGLRNKDIVSTKGYELDRLHTEMSLAWGKLLLDTNRLDECIDVLNQALKHDRTHDALVRALYHAYISSNQRANANKLLKQYENDLRTDEYAPDEIAETVKTIWDVDLSSQPNAQ